MEKLWADLLEARSNTEAMAFRGHRLLDQVGGGGMVVGGTRC